MLNHRTMSNIKCYLRLVGNFVLMFGALNGIINNVIIDPKMVFVYVAFMVVAEVFGILEEVYDKREEK